jgi:hypothetical protein
MNHECHAHGCEVQVPPKLFMCKSHWYKLRKKMRDAIWNEYRPGQEDNKNPSTRYMAVQQRAVAEIAFKEFGIEVAKRYSDNAEHYRDLCIVRGHGDPLEALSRRVVKEILENV